MSMYEYKIKLLSPTLCHGAAPRESAELRVPSIRGHLRKWHTILWGKADTHSCWGCVSENEENQSNKKAIASKEEAIASKVVLRITDAEEIKSGSFCMLPHKKGCKNGQTKGLSANQKFTLCVSFRHLPENPAEAEKLKEQVNKTIQIWLLLGTLGQRSTRAFGSVWNNEKKYNSVEEFAAETNLLIQGKYAVQILKPRKSTSPQDMLKYCTDTLNGYPHIFGAIGPRQVSPLKMKFIEVGNQTLLVLHALKHNTIDEALRVLKNHVKDEKPDPKPLATEFDVIKKIG